MLAVSSATGSASAPRVLWGLPTSSWSRHPGDALQRLGSMLPHLILRNSLWSLCLRHGQRESDLHLVAQRLRSVYHCPEALTGRSRQICSGRRPRAEDLSPRVPRKEATAWSEYWMARPFTPFSMVPLNSPQTPAESASQTYRAVAVRESSRRGQRGRMGSSRAEAESVGGSRSRPQRVWRFMRGWAPAWSRRVERTKLVRPEPKEGPAAIRVAPHAMPKNQLGVRGQQIDNRFFDHVHAV